MPTSASLVTNLPADFNTFGQGVDTSLQDLLGGTTGQVLSKTSGTNMDFTWVTPTDQTPLTTKGDLFTFSTVDARLGVGTNGQTLVADSTASTGLKWATPAGGGGKVLQVVSGNTTTQTNIASTSMTDTTITATITPTSATSTILILISANSYTKRSAANAGSAAQLMRGASAIRTWTVGDNGWQFISAGGAGDAHLKNNQSIVYQDSPATTSATTYKLQARSEVTSNSGQVVFQEGGASGITLMEIGA